MNNPPSATEPVLPTYQASGRVSTSGAVRFFVVAAPVGLLTGGLYGSIVSPRWHLAAVLVCSLLCALLVGAVAQTLLKRAASRSKRFSTAGAAYLVLLFLWARWVAAIAQMFDWTTAFSAADPRLLLPALWKIAMLSPSSGGDHSGFGWYVLSWVLELLVFAWIGIGLARMQADEPYSESSSQWAKEQFRGELVAFGASSADFKPALLQEGVGRLLRMKSAAEWLATPLTMQWWTVHVVGKAATPDASDCWLDVTEIHFERDDSGKVKHTKHSVIVSWHVERDEFDAVREQLTRPAASETAPNDAAESEPHKSAPVTDVALQPAEAALRAENWGLAHTLAQAQWHHPDGTVAADAYRLCALASARMDRWEQAFEEYHKLFDLEPSAKCALDLAGTSVKVGELVRGHAWFERAEKINAETRQLSWPAMRTNFLSALDQQGEYAACVPHIDWLAGAYHAVRVTDDHYLWTKDLPFLGQFLQKSQPILRSVLGDAEAKAWFLRFREGLDDDGQARVNALVEAWQG